MIRFKLELAFLIFDNPFLFCRFSATFSGENMDKQDECSLNFEPVIHKEIINITYFNQAKIESFIYEIPEHGKILVITLSFYHG